MSNSQQRFAKMTAASENVVGLLTENELDQMCAILEKFQRDVEKECQNTEFRGTSASLERQMASFSLSGKRSRRNSKDRLPPVDHIHHKQKRLCDDACPAGKSP